MKELSIEQKAKAYDEALKKAKKLCLEKEVVVAEYLFPELKESEDERIRKKIIQLVNDAMATNAPYKKEMLAWLEKQSKNNIGISEATKQKLEDNLNKALEKETPESWNKFLDEQGEQKPIDPDTLIQQRVDALADIVSEQKPTDKVEPKFKIGDWVIDKQGIVHQIANVIENVTNHTYSYDIVGGGYFNDNTEGVRLWTIQDAKDGDVLVASDGSIFLFKGTIDCACKHYVALTTDGAFKFNEGLEHFWETSRAVHPATKEQCDLLFQKMHEAGYEWDAEKKELKKIELQSSQWNISDFRTWQYIVSDVLTKHDGIGQYLDDGFCKKISKYMQENWSKKLSIRQNTAEWSEEDDQYLLVCKNALAKYQVSDKWDATIISRWLEDKLKSLRPQKQWKPSDEQMVALEHAINCYSGISPTNTEEVYTLEIMKEQLKKLTK